MEVQRAAQGTVGIIPEIAGQPFFGSSGNQSLPSQIPVVSIGPQHFHSLPAPLLPSSDLQLHSDKCRLVAYTICWTIGLSQDLPQTKHLRRS